MTETKPGTTFTFPAGADVEKMTSLGLTGIAVASNRALFGAMAISFGAMARVPEAETITDETNICMEQVMKRLDVVGSGKEDILKITAYAQEKEFIREMWEALDAFLGEHKPKRITLVAGIGVDCRLEFEILAAVREEGRA